MSETTELDIEDDGENSTVMMGLYGTAVWPVYDAAAEILVLWATNQPSMRKQNFFVRQSSHSLSIDACGHLLSIFQSPSSMGTPGVTGAVMWDSGVVLAKFMEHAVDSKRLLLMGKNVVELGSGCGLVGFEIMIFFWGFFIHTTQKNSLFAWSEVYFFYSHLGWSVILGSSCVAALLGANVILTDLHDRLKLLKKNVDVNVGVLGNARGSARVMELTWGDDIGTEFVETLPDFVVGSDIIYSEDAVTDLLYTLRQLSGSHTTIFLAGELRNDAVLECFLEAALEEFQVGHIDQTQWHPEFRSHRVVLFVLVKRSNKEIC